MHIPLGPHIPGQHCIPGFPLVVLHVMTVSQHIPGRQWPLQHTMLPAGPPRGQHLALAPQHMGPYDAGQQLVVFFLQHDAPPGDHDGALQHVSASVLQTVPSLALGQQVSNFLE